MDIVNFSKISEVLKYLKDNLSTTRATNLDAIPLIYTALSRRVTTTWTNFNIWNEPKEILTTTELVSPGLMTIGQNSSYASYNTSSIPFTVIATDDTKSITASIRSTNAFDGNMITGVEIDWSFNAATNSYNNMYVGLGITNSSSYYSPVSSDNNLIRHYGQSFSRNTKYVLLSKTETNNSWINNIFFHVGFSKSANDDIYAYLYLYSLKLYYSNFYRSFGNSLQLAPNKLSGTIISPLVPKNIWESIFYSSELNGGNIQIDLIDENGTTIKSNVQNGESLLDLNQIPLSIKITMTRPSAGAVSPKVNHISLNYLI